MKPIQCISSELAKAIDIELMGAHQYSIYQLMELAGLSVAQSIHHAITSKYLPCTKPINELRILTICGPGSIHFIR